MWTRAQLKTAAKADLTGFYWLSFVVCLVAGILSGSGSTSGFMFGFNYSYNPDFAVSVFFITTLLFTFLFVFAFAAAFGIFVTNPIAVGKCRFFVHPNAEDRDFVTLFHVFKKESYLPVVKSMFFTSLFIFLWTLLFIIPGIVKSYAYRMVPYLLSENPKLEYKEAMELSTAMTDGEKFNMFVLDLSFIGWYILAMFAFGIGILFVNPYVEATWAQFYLAMRAKIAKIPAPAYQN